jgi:hypothetical protein
MSNKESYDKKQKIQVYVPNADPTIFMRKITIRTEAKTYLLSNPFASLLISNSSSSSNSSYIPLHQEDLFKHSTAKIRGQKKWLNFFF